jgi:ubiquinone/menaquinone biosynthesis C-methylase UbiE
LCIEYNDAVNIDRQFIFNSKEVISVMEEHVEKIRRAFGKQASAFEDQKLSLKSEKYIQWILDSLPLSPDLSVIDVACGTGIMARAIAPYVSSVVGIDITREMLHAARQQAEEKNLNNIEFIECDARNICFEAQSFDLAISRFSIHHFANPLLELREMHRVIKKSGHLAIVDLMAPSEKSEAEKYNQFERARDPSHAAAYSFNELQNLVRKTGLHVIHTDVQEVEVNVNNWLSLSETPQETRKHIREALLKNIKGGGHTVMSPFIDQSGELMFRQNWMLVFAVKS